MQYLAGGGVLRHKADERYHGEAAVPDLVPLRTTKTTVPFRILLFLGLSSPLNILNRALCHNSVHHNKRFLRSVP